MYNSSIAEKHCLNLFCTPSLPRACNVHHKGNVGNFLDNESAIKPDIRDNVVSRVVGLPPFVSVNLYNVCVILIKKKQLLLLTKYSSNQITIELEMEYLKGYNNW